MRSQEYAPGGGVDFRGIGMFLHAEEPDRDERDDDPDESCPLGGLAECESDDNRYDGGCYRRDGGDHIHLPFRQATIEEEESRDA
jgi:hypothetical protein